MVSSSAKRGYVSNFHGAVGELAKLELAEQALMDSIFLLGEADRATFLRHMMQSFGCTYICLWSYLPPPSNCLLFWDGIYREESIQQPSSSSESLARTLFSAYCGLENYVDHGCAPGFAFKNSLPYMEMKLDHLERLASSDVQMNFYKEAGIKIVVFMGCATGEIEIGLSSEPQVNLERELRNWFPADFSTKSVAGEHHPFTNQNLPSTSSSSLGSLSADSIEYSPSFFKVPGTSFITELPGEALVGESHFQEALRLVPVSAPIITSPYQQAIRALSQIGNIQFPAIESEDAATTRAIIAALSSSSTSSSSQQTAQDLPHISPVSHVRTAFTGYRAALTPVAGRTRKHNLFKRAVFFFRNLNMKRTQELQTNQGNGPTTAQLHHMIQERRRREKLNVNFQVLKSLLPHVSKKDKASVLRSTTKYLSLLKSQVEELREKNHLLETQLLTTKTEKGEQVLGFANSSTGRVNVEIAHVSPSTSEARFFDLRVRLRTGKCSFFDLAIRIFDFLKKQRNVSLWSLQSNTSMVECTPVHGLILRLKIDGDEFDEPGFREAVKRVVDDLPR